MLKKPAVCINIAAEAELVRLHSIGPRLAKRIVSYRDSNGYFYGPEDLSGVQGISLELAQTLEPQIDWQLPESQEQPKRSWVNIVLAACFLFLSIHLAYRAVVYIPTWLEALSRPEVVGLRFWAATGKFAAQTMANFSIAFAVLCASLIWMSRGPRKVRLLNRLMLLATGAWLMGQSLGYLGEGVYYQYYAPGGWHDLLDDPAYLFGVACFPLFLLLAVVPVSLALWKPELARNSIVVGAYDYGWTSLYLLIVAVSLGISVWTGEFDVLGIIANLILGLLGVFYALAVLGGVSMFELTYDVVTELLFKPSERTMALDRWRVWLQDHLPDPKEQVELKQALEEMHPASKLSILKGAILLTAGTWLLLQAAAATFEWILQGWLNTHLGWF